MQDTPDLSKEFHPVPKPAPKGKKPPKPLGPGKKTHASMDAVEILKKKFYAYGITTCELFNYKHDCWKNTALTFAHRDKRIHLSADDIKDPRKVALICTPGHMAIEVLSREEMGKIIDEIVKVREQNI